MFILRGYTENLENTYTAFPEDPESFLKSVINYSQVEPLFTYDLMVKQQLQYLTIEVLGDILALLCIDDLVVEFNLYALRQNKDLIELFQKIYPDTDIELYSDLKKNLPEATSRFFTKAFKEEVQHYKLNLENLQVSGKTYSIDVSEHLLKNEEYNLRFYVSNYAQCSVIIMGAPPYGSRYVRADIRPISEIEGYTFALCNKSKDSQFVTDMCFFVPYTQERLSILNKEV